MTVMVICNHMELLNRIDKKEMLIPAQPLPLPLTQSQQTMITQHHLPHLPHPLPPLPPLLLHPQVREVKPVEIENLLKDVHHQSLLQLLHLLHQHLWTVLRQLQVLHSTHLHCLLVSCLQSLDLSSFVS